MSMTTPGFYFPKHDTFVPVSNQTEDRYEPRPPSHT